MARGRIAEFALTAIHQRVQNAYRLKGNADGKPRRLSAAPPSSVERLASAARSRALDLVTAHTRVRSAGERDRRCRARTRVDLVEQFVCQIESSTSVRSSRY